MSNVIQLPKRSRAGLIQDMHGLWYVARKGTDRLDGPYLTADKATEATGVYSKECPWPRR
jgi:hypothetical protein